jgi:hypothetical protein
MKLLPIKPNRREAGFFNPEGLISAVILILIVGILTPIAVRLHPWWLDVVIFVLLGLAVFLIVSDFLLFRSLRRSLRKPPPKDSEGK